MRDWIIAKYLRGPEHPAKLRVVRALSRTVVPKAGVIAKVHPDLSLHLHPDDWIEHLLLRGHSYEPLTLAFIRSNLSSGDGAILAGVNFGLHVAVAARAVGPRGLVLGVEPQPAALLRARMNLELNGLESQVVLVAAALGAEEQTTHMAWSKSENTGAASLLDEGPGFVVPMLQMRSVLPLLAGRTPRLLLLDVQGYEQQVLAGMDLINGPDLLILEVDADFLRKAGSSPEQLAHTLTAAGYELFTIEGGSPGEPLGDLPENNLVAVRNGAKVCWDRA